MMHWSLDRLALALQPDLQPSAVPSGQGALASVLAASAPRCTA